MNSRNMLSVNKVKLHGMTSTKWTTRDKITQYKGLISLYTRDKKIIDMDTTIAQKRHSKEIKQIQKEIEENRRDLDNACGGDKQQLRNTLAVDKKLQMAFTNSKPEKVIDMARQLKFTKRKMKDMLKYRMKQKADELIDLKLKYAFYEDRLKFESYSWQAMLPTEKEATLVTGKVQDAILKKEAAIYIRNAYREMIAIMKKDAIYFDAILVSIREDQIRQGKCLLNATKMGQLGTEYLDDRRQEYQALEAVVKADIINRKKDLANVQQNVQKLTNSLKNLLRRDSDINLGKVEIEKTDSYINLTDELFTIETTLTNLKNSIFTQTIESIYPCIQEQYRQKDRLTDFLNNCIRDRAELEKRCDHAKGMHSHLLNTMVDTTTQYNAEKKELRQNIAQVKEKKTQLEILIEARYTLLANVRISLGHLQYLSRLMMTPGSSGHVKFMTKRKVEVQDIEQEADETEATKIIPELISRFAKLIARTNEILTGKTKEDGYQTFERMMITRTKPVQVDIVISEESLIETIFTDANILSRADIKRQSAEIVAANMVNEDAPVDPKKRKFKFR